MCRDLLCCKSYSQNSGGNPHGVPVCGTFIPPLSDSRDSGYDRFHPRGFCALAPQQSLHDAPGRSGRFVPARYGQCAGVAGGRGAHEHARHGAWGAVGHLGRQRVGPYHRAASASVHRDGADVGGVSERGAAGGLARGARADRQARQAPDLRHVSAKSGRPADAESQRRVRCPPRGRARLRWLSRQPRVVTDTAWPAR
ncbi:hypothetical protein G6F65_021160 [Rhizopus arrhizus]|nr:hypothetical protein G6F65_021160 [Rhizopus arrhizus]